MAGYDDTTDVTVTLPSGLLAAVDEAARERGHDARAEAVRAALLAWVGADEQTDSDDSGGALSGLSDRLGTEDVDVDVGVDVGVDE